LGKEACWQADAVSIRSQATEMPPETRRSHSARSGRHILPTAPYGLPSSSPRIPLRARGRSAIGYYEPEFREGDFESLNDINQGAGPVDDYHASEAFIALCRAIQFWMELANIDGLRIDTVKHVDDAASRLFTSVIHEFAQTLGKENFYLIGELTGGRQRAFTTLE
jgi:glycosidase